MKCNPTKNAQLPQPGFVLASYFHRKKSVSSSKTVLVCHPSSLTVLTAGWDSSDPADAGTLGSGRLPPVLVSELYSSQRAVHDDRKAKKDPGAGNDASDGED